MFVNHSLPHHEILRSIFGPSPSPTSTLPIPLHEILSPIFRRSPYIYTPYIPYTSSTVDSFTRPIDSTMTDQPNIFTRSHKKNGNNGKEKEQSTETPIISEDKAISQSAFLPEFSTEQAQSLSTFINETIQTANASLRAEMTAQFALLPATIANLMNTTNIQTTQPIGSNCLNSAPAQEPTSDGASYQSGFPARNFPAPPGRWRPEELGIFDSDTDDVYTFVERIREMTDIKRDSHMIQLNLSLQLRKKAKRWFELELSHENKTVLYNPANGTNA